MYHYNTLPQFSHDSSPRRNSGAISTGSKVIVHKLTEVEPGDKASSHIQCSVYMFMSTCSHLFFLSSPMTKLANILCNVFSHDSMAHAHCTYIATSAYYEAMYNVWMLIHVQLMNVEVGICV